MTATMQHLDASRRRALRDSLRRLTGHDLAEVRITRVHWDNGLRWVALALADHQPYPTALARRREIPVIGSQHREIARLIRDAFPEADWSRAQDYDVATGTLTEHQVQVPACLRGEQL